VKDALSIGRQPKIVAPGLQSAERSLERDEHGAASHRTARVDAKVPWRVRANGLEADPNRRKKADTAIHRRREVLIERGSVFGATRVEPGHPHNARAVHRHHLIELFRMRRRRRIDGLRLTPGRAPVVGELDVDASDVVDDSRKGHVDPILTNAAVTVDAELRELLTTRARWERREISDAVDANPAPGGECLSAVGRQDKVPARGVAARDR
jgi:hypothetical protein